MSRVVTEVGRPTRYDESPVNHWLNGIMPRKEAARAAIPDALARRLFRFWVRVAP
ncbi:hypothetical protein [Streptomyces tsukubensis]|uniref:hypothetical protein n=1 Tax=Streptomyces tsukubensis TaxID=83656 RepID=UPI0015C2FB90|nr:hypothetical protein [Streptomyces tsukubensis]